MGGRCDWLVIDVRHLLCGFGAFVGDDVARRNCDFWWNLVVLRSLVILWHGLTGHATALLTIHLTSLDVELYDDQVSARPSPPQPVLTAAVKYATILREPAYGGHIDLAQEVFETYLELVDAGDQMVLAQLAETLCARGQGDFEDALDYASRLEKASPDAWADLDAEDLEEVVPKRQKTTKEKGNEEDAKKRKRKPKLPKGFDAAAGPDGGLGPIDTERWLPLRERSYYKPKRGKRGANKVGGGPQGGVAEVGTVEGGGKKGPSTAAVEIKTEVVARKTKNKKKKK